jgi:hypothetical protein|tara:strand:- start:744 stop:851 length:108 start_codon:yes stop_codon:yes gene_type:complete
MKELTAEIMIVSLAIKIIGNKRLNLLIFSKIIKLF